MSLKLIYNMFKDFSVLMNSYTFDGFKFLSDHVLRSDSFFTTWMIPFPSNAYVTTFCKG